MTDQDRGELLLIATGCTHPGKRRRNEDAYFCAPATNLYVVADGIGGERAGEVASAIAVLVIQRGVQQIDVDADTVGAALRVVIGAADKIIRETSRDPAHRAKYHDMGTTLVALLARDARAAVGHAGDSRCYRLRAGAECVEQVTVDHVVEGTHAITRDLGGDDKEVGDIQELDLAVGDVFVLCTDGLNALPVTDLERILRAGGEADDLVRAVLALDVPHQDNVTAVVVRVVVR